MSCISIVPTWSWKNSKEKSELVSEKSIHIITESSKEQVLKISRQHCCLKISLWYLIPYIEGINTTSIWSSQKSVTIILILYKSNGSLTNWWHRLLPHYRWSLTRIYIRRMYIYNLHTTNINRFIKKKEKKMVSLWKRQEAHNISQKLW